MYRRRTRSNLISPFSSRARAIMAEEDLIAIPPPPPPTHKQSHGSWCTARIICTGDDGDCCHRCIRITIIHIYYTYISVIAYIIYSILNTVAIRCIHSILLYYIYLHIVRLLKACHFGGTHVYVVYCALLGGKKKQNKSHL